MSFEGPFVVPGLEVPDLDGGVLAPADHQAEDRMEYHPKNNLYLADIRYHYWQAHNPTIF